MRPGGWIRRRAVPSFCDLYDVLSDSARGRMLQLYIVMHTGWIDACTSRVRDSTCNENHLNFVRSSGNDPC